METLWLDALSFPTYGSFIPETQFVREMGQGYLLENAVGTPGAPAACPFTLREGGMYRLYVRTKNWLPEYTPDSLMLSVDGTPTGQEAGTAPREQWHFAAAGDVSLSPGEHSLSVASSKGWFARFAAFIITNDPDFVPSPEETRWKEQRKRYLYIPTDQSIISTPLNPPEPPHSLDPSSDHYSELLTDHSTIQNLSSVDSDVFSSTSLKSSCSPNILSSSASVSRSYDLIVIGAGTAGVVAAIAASRQGLKTLLLSDRPVLGGNGSTESAVALEGAAHRGVHERGIILEIKLYRHHHRCSWSEAFEHFTKQESNLTVLKNILVDNASVSATNPSQVNAEDSLTVSSSDRAVSIPDSSLTIGDVPASDVVNSNNNPCDCKESSVEHLPRDFFHINTVHAVHTYTLEEYTFSAPLYVDATGDGWLGYYANASYHIGREAQWEYEEPLALRSGDDNTMSGCATVPTKDYAKTLCSYEAVPTDHGVPFTAPAWAFVMPEGDALSREPAVLTHGEWWLENRNSYDDLWEAEAARDAMIRLSVGYFHWLKNSWSGREAAANLELKRIGTYLAKRETRRLLGDYVMTQQDFLPAEKIPKEQLNWDTIELEVLSPLTFPDTVAYTGWAIDVHHVDGIFSGKESAFFLNQRGRVTPIPFRSLYSRNVDNLMMAGRNISVTHLALGPTRVMLTGALMGEAVGTAAVLCLEKGILPRDIGKSIQVSLSENAEKAPIPIHNWLYARSSKRHPTPVAGTGSNTDGCTENYAHLLQQRLLSNGVWLPHVEPDPELNLLDRAMARIQWDEPEEGKGFSWTLTYPLPEPNKTHELSLVFPLPNAEFSYGLNPDLPEMPGIPTDISIWAVMSNTQEILLAHVSDNYQYRRVFTLDPLPAGGEEITESSAIKEIQIRLQYADSGFPGLPDVCLWACR